MSTKCVSYYRTSSLTNTGEEKDSLKRQKYVVNRFCNKNGYEIENEFYDTLSGDREILSRPKFVEMMEFCESSNIKTIVFENTTRFSRDLICSETGYEYLKGLGYTLISSESPESFVDDSPTSVLIRRVLSCLSDFEKNSIVEKLRGSRIRKRSVNKEKGIVTRNRDGKVEGRKRILEIHPELESLILKLRKKGLSWVNISKTLSDEFGYSISSMSVGRILKDIEWMKKEKRRMNRKKKIISNS